MNLVYNTDIHVTYLVPLGDKSLGGSRGVMSWWCYVTHVLLTVQMRPYFLLSVATIGIVAGYALVV